MIIITQDKTEIVNFENIENVWIANEEGEFTIEATADTNTTLGIYKTEERAKEVLQQIKIAYANTEMVKIPKINIKEEISGTELARCICYEMPKS